MHMFFFRSRNIFRSPVHTNLSNPWHILRFALLISDSSGISCLLSFFVSRLCDQCAIFSFMYYHLYNSVFLFPLIIFPLLYPLSFLFCFLCFFFLFLLSFFFVSRLFVLPCFFSVFLRQQSLRLFLASVRRFFRYIWMPL